MGKEAWILYVLECRDGSLYTGITNNLPDRLVAHESGKGAKYTRGRAPFRVVHTEKFASRSQASIREAQVKALDKLGKLELINNHENA